MTIDQIKRIELAKTQLQEFIEAQPLSPINYTVQYVEEAVDLLGLVLASATKNPFSEHWREEA